MGHISFRRASRDQTLFMVIMINDLAISNASLWKYVDDTTTSEVSNAQTIADEVADWSNRNRVKLNTDKCKELRIFFFLLQLVMISLL